MGADWNQHSRLIKKNISEIIKPAFEPQTTRTLPTSSRAAFPTASKPLELKSTSSFYAAPRRPRTRRRMKSERIKTGVKPIPSRKSGRLRPSSRQQPRCFISAPARLARSTSAAAGPCVALFPTPPAPTFLS